MGELEIGKVVDEDFLREDDDDAVAAEADAPDLGAERELANAAGLVVVPDHDLRFLQLLSLPFVFMLPFKFVLFLRSLDSDVFWDP